MAKFETHLSLSSLNEMIKRLENKEKNYPEVGKRIVDRLSDEMLEDVKQTKTVHGASPYENSRKKPIKVEDNTVIGGIENKDKKAYYNEFGTGVKGSFPNMNYKDEGWWYKTDENDKNTTKRWIETDDYTGWIAFTNGLPSLRAFDKASDKAEERFYEVGLEELQKE